MADSTITAVNPQAVAPAKVETQAKPQAPEAAKTDKAPETKPQEVTGQATSSPEQGKKLNLYA